MDRNDLPRIEDVTWRPWDDGDYSGMVALLNADLEEGGHDEHDSEDGFVRGFEELERFDPFTDVLIAETPDGVAGYVAAMSWRELDGTEILFHAGRVDPAWKRRGIGTGLLQWGQGRLIELTGDDGTRIMRTSGVSPSTTEFMVKNGYQVTQHMATMVRPNLDDIAEYRLPDGVEVRAVGESDLRAIYEAEVEHFRDHWGASEEEAGWWENFKTDPRMDLVMWQVAFEGDEIIGLVRPHINQEENEKMARKRGYTEEISTRRDWRGKGVASALISRAMVAQRDRGMEETALSVHVENPHGAYRLYEAHGFRLHSRIDTLDKPLT